MRPILFEKFKDKIPFFKKDKHNPWLYPTLTNPHYYNLVQLKTTLEQIIACYVAPLQQTELVAVDMGCGVMPYRSLFTPLVSKYIGADLSSNPQADICMDQATAAIALEADSVDLILSTQVLEHVENPELYLAEARRLCKPDGLLILSTHGHWVYHPTPQDYWRWTSMGLCKLLEQNGFEVIYQVGLLGLMAMGLQFIQEVIINPLPHKLKVAVTIVMQSLISLVDKLASAEARNKDAGIFVLVARKRAGEQS
jgi:SAM-dependent methyltransferase